MTDLPLPKHGSSSRCEHHLVAKRRFIGDLATIVKECLSIGMVVETETAPLGLEFVTFFLKKKGKVFFFLLHPPFFLGAVGDEAAFGREIRRHQTSHTQEVAMQAAMAAVQAVMQGGDNPAAAGVGPFPVPPPKAKAEAETKAEAKAKSSRKRRWTNVSLIHYFFRGYLKSMEWNFLKLNVFFAIFFFKAFEAEWKKWNDDWEAEKKAKSDAAPKVP